MMCYLVQPREKIFIKDYRFFFFTNNMGENIDTTDATDAFKTVSKRAIKKTVEASGDLIGN